MRRRLCLILACAVTLFPLHTPAQTDSDAARLERREQIKRCRAYLKDAVPAIAEESYDSALVLLGYAQECDPKNPDVFYHLARVHIRRGDTAEAVTALQTGVERAPLSSRLKLFLARLQIDQNRHDDAAELIDAVLAIKPREGEALFLQGLVYWNRGDTAQAVANMQRALEISLGRDRK